MKAQRPQVREAVRHVLASLNTNRVRSHAAAKGARRDAVTGKPDWVAGAVGSRCRRCADLADFLHTAPGFLPATEIGWYLLCANCYRPR